MNEKIFDMPPIYWVMVGFVCAAIVFSGRRKDENVRDYRDTRTGLPVMHVIVTNPDGSMVTFAGKEVDDGKWRDGSKG